MLHKKSITPGSVISLRLVSGEEIIAILASYDQVYYGLKSPLILVKSADGFEFVPYMYTVDPNNIIYIENTNVISSAYTHPYMVTEYYGRIQLSAEHEPIK